MTTGLLSIQESLQLDVVLEGKAEVEERTVPVNDLSPPKTGFLAFKEMQGPHAVASKTYGNSRNRSFPISPPLPRIQRPERRQGRGWWFSWGARYNPAVESGGVCCGLPASANGCVRYLLPTLKGVDE